MTTLGLILLALVAALFVLAPVLARRAGSSGAHVSDDARRALYRQRLDELSKEAEDSELRAELEDELGSSLLNELELAKADGAAGEGSGHSNAGERRVGIWALGGLVPVGAALLFFALVDVGLGEIQGAEAVMNLNPERDEALIRDWQARLAARAVDAPEDSKSLYLLGHARLKLEDYAGAAEAFARVNQLTPDDLSVQVYWLQSRFLARRGRLDTAGEALAQSILERAPNVPVVLEILALNAAGKQEPEAAVTYLNRAMAGSRDVAQQIAFINAIGELRKRFEQPGISVSVSATQEPPHGATLFVIARPVGGGMPLAVVRMPALLLPQEVRLDDLVAMNPSFKLSQMDAFEIVTRVSLSGTPMPQPGDWEWRSPPVTVSSGPHEAVLTPPETLAGSVSDR